MAIQIINNIIEEGAYGEDTVYGVNASETNSKNIQYTWQCSNDGGNIWQNVSSMSLPPNLIQSLKISQSTTVSSSISKINILQSFKDVYPNSLFKVVLSASGENNVESMSFGQYQNVTISILSGNSSFENNRYNFKVFANATISDDMFIVPKFKWQKSTNEGASWTSIEQEKREEGEYLIENNNLDIIFSGKINVNMKIRAVVTATGSLPQFSNVFNVFYNSTTNEPTISIIFTGSSIDPNNNIVHSVIGTSTDSSQVSYQWQKSDNFSDWENIESNSNISGINSSNLILKPQYFQQNPIRIYRCILSSVSVPFVYSRTFGSDSFGLQINFVYSGGLNNSNPYDSIGGDPSINSISGNLNNLFSDVSMQDSEVGIVDYRCFYVTNDSINGEKLYNTTMYLTTEYNTQSSIQLGISRENESQEISLSTTPTSGSFKLKIGPLVTNPIIWNSNQNLFLGNIGNALNNLELINVSVQKTLFNNYQITFINDCSYRNYDLIEIVENNLLSSSQQVSIQVEKKTEGRPINSKAPKIFNSQSAPFNVTFYDTNANSRLLIGDLYPGDVVPIWIRRYTYGQVNTDQLNGFNIRINGNKNKVNIPINISTQQIENADFFYG